MGVKSELERWGLRLWKGQRTPSGAPRKANPNPAEIVVYLPPTETQNSETVAASLHAAFPVGRAVQGVDLLTGAIEVRFYFDANLLARLTQWLVEHDVTYDISYLY